jgi:hypothetical protein
MSYISENFHKFVPKFGKYSNGRIALEYLIIDEDMQMLVPACTATINLPHIELADDEVIVKNYSEGEGLYESMLLANHIGPAIRYVQTGFVEVPVCKLLLEK